MHDVAGLTQRSQEPPLTEVGPSFQPSGPRVLNQKPSNSQCYALSIIGRGYLTPIYYEDPPKLLTPFFFKFLSSTLLNKV